MTARSRQTRPEPKADSSGQKKTHGTTAVGTAAAEPVTAASTLREENIPPDYVLTTITPLKQ